MISGDHGIASTESAERLAEREMQVKRPRRRLIIAGGREVFQLQPTDPEGKAELRFVGTSESATDAYFAKLPVVPVSVSGSRHVMQKGRLMVQPGRVRLTIHAPVSTAGVGRAQVIEFAERIRAIVRADV